jgi:hypothetical protein
LQHNHNSGMTVSLPDTYNLLSDIIHKIEVRSISTNHGTFTSPSQITECRFEQNTAFQLRVAGYFAFVNISSNNFSANYAPINRGLVHLRGMDKLLTIERNRFNKNMGNWMVKHEMWGHTIRVSRKHLKF